MAAPRKCLNTWVPFVGVAAATRHAWKVYKQRLHNGTPWSG